jgi:hypothetical protein
MLPFDPADRRTWPLWMRVSDIATRPGYRGPYPGSRAQWWLAVKAGRIPPPHKFSTRISAWHRDTVAAVTLPELLVEAA